MTSDDGVHAAHYGLREEIVDGLRGDLLGPAGGDQELLLDDAPVTVYPIGVLFPQAGSGSARQAMDEDAAEVDGPDVTPFIRGGGIEDQAPDLGVAMANERKPSSMGLTFAVDPTITPTITVSTKAAIYTPEDAEGRPVEPKRVEARSTEAQRERWRRRSLEILPATIDVTRPGMRASEELADGLQLRALIREPSGPARTVTVTVTLINDKAVGEFDLQDAYCFFQPVLEVSGSPGSRPFVERSASLGAVDEDQAVSRLLHRHVPTFATGHGCAAQWDWEPPAVGATMKRTTAVESVRTEFLPSHEVLLTDSNPDIDDGSLTMQGLATLSDENVLTALFGLVSGYEAWIDTRTAEIKFLPDAEYKVTAGEQMELCGQALRRMKRGVGLLSENPEVMEAFRLSNAAMARQRARSAWVKSGRKGAVDLEAGKWRPFQISFILLCLEGVVDPNHGDREIADLLWFPTGGGKTEAYLGLIAFTTFLRRIRRGATGGGVTVLIRYTLRLLTLQQFERAATLICAMEQQRRTMPKRLGTEPISIGMWVGASATPNLLKHAQDSLDELLRGKPLQDRNPVQLHNCPWCGTPMDANQYAVDEEAKRMFVYCPDSACDYHSGLPVHLIDESIYDVRPTLVIATVDKFASMPWRERTAALFNRDRRDGTPPPELVVQDELHLISGPLGTLTGLYETAVDLLADRPKVIASTATIRRASRQGKALFDRSVSQFPPAGLDARDSWFAVETPRERKAARRYVGLLTSSTSQATLLVRTYAALLHHTVRAETTDDVRDAYWTLVGYFNSLRLLAAADLQVRDDVHDRLEYLAKRDGLAAPRPVDELTELTSRADSSEIPRRLKQVERALPHPETVDVLLATNMISVGVDVDRLGLMAVMGQPQTTAEYIQATSRVGRRHPGLVAVMLNSARSRDRSHYEGFLHFHSALYREVESTSVTPFSARSRDRGLHAVIVALARILLPKARPNEAAGRIYEFHDDLLGIIRPAFLARVGVVAPEEHAATAEAYDDFVQWWREEADMNGGLLYEPERGKKTPALLRSFDDESEANAWPTLWSLRDVDAESALFLESSR